MKRRKLLIGLLLLTFVVCIIPQATAADSMENTTLDDSNQVEIDEDIALETSEGESNENGTLTDLTWELREEYVELNRDYVYTPEIDDKMYLKDGATVGQDVIVKGNGHTIYSKGARSLYVASHAVVAEFYDLNFINIFTPEVLSTYTGQINKEGGAIYNLGNLYLENCTFINNYATECGGAIYNINKSYPSNLILKNCTFINSFAGINGGAIYSRDKIQVIGCSFYNSSADYGGAIYTGTESYISNSYFKNSTAEYDGGAVFNSKQNICDVYNSTFNGNAAQNGGALMNCIATECTFAGNNIASVNGSDLYNCVNINCIFENEDFNNCYATINSTGLSFKPLDLNVDETLNVIVTSNPSGEKIGGIVLNIFLEDSEKNVCHLTVSSDEDGIASLSLRNFKNGTYKLGISFSNDAYGDKISYYDLLVGKVDSKVTFSTSIVFEYGKVGSIYVNVEGGTLELKNIKVLNHPEAVKSLNGNILTISGLNVGSYTLQVTTTPDEFHFTNVATIGITVKKAVAVITASKLTVALKKNTLWSIKLVDSKTNNPIRNMKLNLKIFTGSIYKIVSVTTDSRGIASYKTSSLSKGTHKIVVSASHSGYIFNTLTSSIKVIKPKALVFKLKKRINDNTGSLISYIVKDKKTKKGVNGVKIKLFIYTGKKYKIVTLKTKKSGKFKGAMGFSTNDLSVGKHKVILKPASIKYSGYAKTSMIIKKSAKKNKKIYSHKL